MSEYKNKKEAKDAIESAEGKIDLILADELEHIHIELRSIGKWLDFYKHDGARKEIKDKLFYYEHIIVDANLYLRHQVTTFDLDVGTKLGQTFF
jgi:hypothetical protein